MLTREEDIEAHALYSSGWTISAIARHLGRDRKTIRAYVTGARAPGVRARPGPDAFEAFAEYARARLGEDPHLWVTTLADELEDLLEVAEGAFGFEEALVELRGPSLVKSVSA